MVCSREKVGLAQGNTAVPDPAADAGGNAWIGASGDGHNDGGTFADHVCPGAGIGG
ncbi:MAG: hypothetical protein KDN22_04410 [Verrucomicrobiae bacterium]|nr:hypothetical protein [Verrucomicrobiae bacterium]